MATESRMHRKGTVWEPSKYCEECLKFGQGNCRGKSPSQKVVLYFGGRRSGRRFFAGLNFCKQYEFDVRLYAFADGSGSGKVETLVEAKQRGQVKQKTEDDQEAFDDFDLGASLSSADFENLI